MRVLPEKTKSTANDVAAVHNDAPRFVMPAKGEWSTNAKGDKSDPINMYVHGSLDDVKQAFLDAGWLVPSSKTVPHMLEYGVAALGHEAIAGIDKFVPGKLPDPFAKTVAHMPIAHAFFRGKPDVMSFEMNNDPVRGRHHFRVFDTGTVDHDGKPVWAIAASLDVKTVIAPDRPEQGFINHIIDPNADKERDFVMASLKKIDAVDAERAVTLPFGDPAPTGLHSKDGRVFDVVIN